jgi:hypothetical protein
MPALLSDWHALVEKRLGKSIDLKSAIQGSGDELPDSRDPLIANYIELVRFAHTLHMDGQRDAVEIYRKGNGWKILDGERRWVATHLLMLHVNGDRDTVLAVEKKPDIFAQATKNGARRPLTATEMARQIALLVIHMYTGDPGVQFDEFETMILSGECDRKYYAQVRDGNQYRIKKGMLEHVLAATGLKSKEQISQYRALLDIPDALWMQADEEGWTEGAIREYVNTAKTPRADADRLTNVNLSSPNQTLNPPVTTTPNGLPLHLKPTLKVGDTVRFFGKEGKIRSINGRIVIVEGMGPRDMDGLQYVRSADAPEATPVAAPVQPEPVDESTIVHDDLSPGEIMRLKQAHTMLFNGDPRDDGWHPQFNEHTQSLVEREYLEMARHKLIIGGEALCLRITPLGCAAIDKPYVVPRTPAAPPVAPETGQTQTSALIEGWANPPLKPTLQFLMKLSDDLGLRLNWSDFDYLLSVDKQGIAAFHADPKRLADDWRAMLDQRSTRIGDLLDMVAKEITDYMTHVYTVGEDVRKGVNS